MASPFAAPPGGGVWLCNNASHTTICQAKDILPSTVASSFCCAPVFHPEFYHARHVSRGYAWPFRGSRAAFSDGVVGRVPRRGAPSPHGRTTVRVYPPLADCRRLQSNQLIRADLQSGVRAVKPDFWRVSGRSFFAVEDREALRFSFQSIGGSTIIAPLSASRRGNGH